MFLIKCANSWCINAFVKKEKYTPYSFCIDTSCDKKKTKYFFCIIHSLLKHDRPGPVTNTKQCNWGKYQQILSAKLSTSATNSPGRFLPQAIMQLLCNDTTCITPHRWRNFPSSRHCVFVLLYSSFCICRSCSPKLSLFSNFIYTLLDQLSNNSTWLSEIINILGHMAQLIKRPQEVLKPL